MKINEPFGPALEQEVADESRRMELEILAQMKSEFQDFVAQTRERLRLVAESLADLDREYALAPSITEQQPAGIPEADDQEVDARENDAQEVVGVQEVVGGQSVVDAAMEPALTDGPELIVDSAASDRGQNEAPVSELNFWPSESLEPNPRPNSREDASTDAPFPGTSNLDSDPSERLNAIKQRLARQIENS